MFNQESVYECKVFLKSYEDAIENVKQAAWKHESAKKYERTMTRISELKERNQIALKDGHPVKSDTFADSREVKLFKFSGYVFKKYLPDFDSYSGDYAGIKKVLDQAIGNLKKDVEVASSASQ